MMNELDLARQFRVYDNMFVLFGRSLQAKPHCHHGIEIVISLEDPFSITCTDEVISAKGAIIRQHVRHSTTGGDGITAYIFVEPEDKLGKALSRVLNGRNVVTLQEQLTGKIAAHLEKHLQPAHCEADLRQCLQDIFLPFDTVGTASYVGDDRVTMIIAHINASLKNPIDFHALKDLSCLSESRLIHLFKAEVGIPIRKYVLWCRLREALRYIERGSNISRGAFQSGFANASHFNHTFVSMLGINPSQIV